jgi:hypothetical protein
MVRFEFEAKLWVYAGEAAWRFVTLPSEVAQSVKALSAARPFGTVAVQATIGDTRWRTSLFADRKAGSYLLPVKADVRRRERLEDGQPVDVALELEL